MTADSRQLTAARLAITWLGHGTFMLTSPGGKRILIDPWLDGNPACPADWKQVKQADLILVTPWSSRSHR